MDKYSDIVENGKFLPLSHPNPPSDTHTTIATTLVLLLILQLNKQICIYLSVLVYLIKWGYVYIYSCFYIVSQVAFPNGSWSFPFLFEKTQKTCLFQATDHEPFTK